MRGVIVAFCFATAGLGPNGWAQESFDTFDPYPQTNLASSAASTPRMVSLTAELWTANLWTPYSRESFTYDSEGRNKTTLRQGWNGMNWIDDSRLEYVHNAEDRLLQRLESILADGMWRPAGKLDFFYPHGQHRARSDLYATGAGEYVRSIWSGSEWTPTDKHVFTYHAEGYLTERQHFGFVNGAWTNSLHYTYAYDTQHRLTKETSHVWDAGRWRESQNREYTYDPHSRLEAVTTYDLSGSAPRLSARSLFYYSDAGREIERIDQVWSGQWSYSGRVGSSYDSNGNLVNSVSQVWQNGTWVNRSQRLIEWSGTVATERFSEMSHTLTLSQNYPNPFNPSTSITYSVAIGTEVTLTVFDGIGRDVAILASGPREPGEHTVTFDATGLPSGVYWYQVRSGRYVETKPMILLK